MEAEQNRNRWRLSRWMRWVRRSDLIERGTVLVIAVAILFSTLYFAWCVVRGVTHDPRLSLLRRAFAEIDDHWRAGLIVLIPLFHRSLTLLLRRLRKGPWGTELAPEEQEQEANPEPRA